MKETANMPAQPITHTTGPWTVKPSTSRAEVKQWLDDVGIPAMRRALACAEGRADA